MWQTFVAPTSHIIISIIKCEVSRCRWCGWKLSQNVKPPPMCNVIVGPAVPVYITLKRKKKRSKQMDELALNPRKQNTLTNTKTCLSVVKDCCVSQDETLVLQIHVCSCPHPQTWALDRDSKKDIWSLFTAQLGLLLVGRGWGAKKFERSSERNRWSCTLKLAQTVWASEEESSRTFFCGCIKVQYIKI